MFQIDAKGITEFLLGLGCTAGTSLYFLTSGTSVSFQGYCSFSYEPVLICATLDNGLSGDPAQAYVVLCTWLLFSLATIFVCQSCSPWTLACHSIRKLSQGREVKLFGAQYYVE